MNRKGFTLIELTIVVVIIGILAAIAIPSFISMQDQARERDVKENMHTLQLAVEDFSVQHGCTYPIATDGDEVEKLLPGGVCPDNPFTGKPCHIYWGGVASGLGELGYYTPRLNEYRITGYGASGPLILELTNY